MDQSGKSPTPPGLDAITSAIIGSAISIHREVGPGLVESVYQSMLGQALTRQGFLVQTQQTHGFERDGMVHTGSFRPDLIINGRVVVEVKSMRKFHVVHKQQLLTYLRLLKLPVGLLINFGEATLRQGLTRIVNDLDPSDSPSLGVNRSDRRLDN